MSKTKITGLSTINFPSTMDGAVLTTTDISKYVNTLFSKLFADYTGCIIKIDQSATPNNPQNQLNERHPVLCDLYFTVGAPKGDDNRLRAFDIIGHDSSNEEAPKKKNRMNFVSRMEVFQMAMTENKTSVITQDAVDIIQDLLWYELKSNMPKEVTPKVFNERGIAVETVTSGSVNGNMFGNTNENKIVYGVIRFIDINEILHLIFGDEENSRCHYEVRPVRPTASMYAGAGMMPNMQMGEQKWLLYVNKLNEKGIRDILTELGTAPVAGPNIVTSTF